MNHSYLEFVRSLSSAAGQVLREAYQQQAQGGSGRRASPKGLKLVEDKTLDQFIIKRIQAAYPEHCILTEESGLIHRSDGACNISTVVKHPHLWVVDPIDGSVNFSIHNPFVAISIALLVEGVPTVGVIEAPLLEEQYVAVRGQGATLNGRPLHVSKTAQLADAYLVSCDGGMTDRTQVFSTLIRNYYDQVKDLRKLGSAALECAFVAAGRADAYLTMTIDSWDVAAGVLLVQEAGGKVTTFEGGEWQPEPVDLICSNGLLHASLLERLW